MRLFPNNPRLPKCKAAASARLCVETHIREVMAVRFVQPPSGGCVLKPPFLQPTARNNWAAAFGRLCVETPKKSPLIRDKTCSHLRAAVC